MRSVVIRRLIAALAATAAALTVTACSGSSSAPIADPPNPSVSASVGPNITPAPTPARLKTFYDQKLAWSTCHGSFQCTTLTVPEDYSKPNGKTLGIAVIRQPSLGTHQGSLIINPGGPGEGGVDFVAQAASLFSGLTDHLDLVSFDPRGVAGSDPVRCLSTSQLAATINSNPDPQTAAGRSALVTQAKQFAAACYRKNGDYLEHIGTIDEARDMDVLRAAVGDSKLTYYGASYGTYLGAKYAQLFPTHIRAMVLDGALDPTLSVNQVNLVQAKGFQQDLGDMLAACVAKGNCPLGSTVAAAQAKIASLRTLVTQHPEITQSGRTLGPGLFFEGVASGLYVAADWPELWTAISQVTEGDPEPLLAFADALTGRNDDGTYSNLVESNLAINCVDRPSPQSVSTYVAKANQFAAEAPDFGAAIEYGLLPCAFWKVPPVEKPHPVHAPDAPPILVIGTTRDPATPYVWAQSLAKQLDSGVLLTYQGDGHTAYITNNSCVHAAVQSYVINLQPPAAGTTCG